jgi:hypothetical protein
MHFTLRNQASAATVAQTSESAFGIRIVNFAGHGCSPAAAPTGEFTVGVSPTTMHWDMLTNPTTRYAGIVSHVDRHEFNCDFQDLRIFVLFVKIEAFVDGATCGVDGLRRSI